LTPRINTRRTLQKVSAYAALRRSIQHARLEVEELRLAAVLHDVGKVGIPEAILNKSDL
jgi:HD-GYP domain-containing protein (c-di-GMP phosphodiesterase class II)